MTIPSGLQETIHQQINGSEGWCTMEKAMVLASIVLEHKPAKAVEIGIFGGRSLFAIGSAMKVIGHGTAVGIDPWSIDAAIEGEVGKENEDWWKNNVDLEEIYRGFVRRVLDYDLSNQVRWVRDKSERVVNLFKDGEIDLFHQDSNHSELVSCRDVDLWHKKVAPEGFWILDDTDWQTQAKAIQMIKDKGFKVVNDFGTYMVFKRGS